MKLQYWDCLNTQIYKAHISLQFKEKKKYNHFEKSWDKLTWDKLELGQIDQSWDELVWDKLTCIQIFCGGK